MLTQRVRAHALWELGRRAEAVVELESVAAQGTEELLPLVRMRASKRMPCASVRLDVLTSLCWGLADHGIMAGGPRYTYYTHSAAP